MGLFNKKVSPEEEVNPTLPDPKPNIRDDKVHDSKINAKKDAKTDDDDSSSTASVGSGGSKNILSKRQKFSKQKGSEKATKRFTNIWIRFSCLFLSPVFLRHRNKIYIVFEVLLPPLVAFAIFAAFTSGISWKKAYYEKVDSEKSIQPKFPEFSMEKAMSSFRNKFEGDTGMVLIFFTPVTNLTHDIMAHALELLNIHDKNKMDFTGQQGTGAVGVENPLELLEKALLHRNENIKHLRPIGVIFHYDGKSLDPDTQVPYHMSYSIRTFDETISHTEDNFPYVKPSRSGDTRSAYVESGFIGLQYAIEYSYFRNLLRKKTSAKVGMDPYSFDLFGAEGTKESQMLLSVEEAPSLKLKMFYSPNYYNSTIRSLIAFTVCCCLVTAYLFTSYFIVRQIVQENKSGIKDLLRMHGMPVYMHWVILFFHALFFRAITAALMTWTLFTKVGHGTILTLSSVTLIFAIMCAHLLALTFFNFFLATMVHSVGLVGLYSTLIGLLSFLIPATFSKFQLIGVISNIFLVALFPNWALYNIFWSIIDFECDDKGVTWSNLYSMDRGGEAGAELMRISEALSLMCCSAIVYLFMAVYRDLTSQVKLFPPSFRWWDVWARSKQRLVNKAHHKELLKDIKEGRGQDFEKPAIYEETDPDKKCFVRLRHVCKRYGKHTMALDTINLNILHEEITVVLGHGGCGKSTLISILAGMVCPTMGYATIKDYDVNFETTKARHYTGLCTQKLIYFNLLSVKQHVFLCYRLRGYDKEECNRHSSTLLTRLRLWNVRSFFPGSLTSDELRRLGIAMAMADAPKVLLLDEPTGGMDAFGRREIWTILKSLRQHHTIVLTSNYMDEAEYLADRIALLAHGRLVCFGSIDFLKKNYDTGYFLKVEPMINVVKLDSNAILSLIKSRLGKHVREKKNKTSKDVDNVIIELPRSQLPLLPDVCDDLDKQQSKLKFKKYSIRQVCLSDIFIKICESIASEKDAPDLYVRRDSTGDIRSALTSQIPTLPESNVSKPTFRNQMQALMIKRWTYMKTKNDFFIWEYLVPLLLIFLVMWEAKIFVSPPVNSPPRKLNYDLYDKDMEIFYKMSTDNFAINYTSHVMKILSPRGKGLLKSAGMSATLMDLIRSNDDTKGLGFIKEQHITALEMRKSSTGKDNSFEMIGHFSSGALHSGPIILNTMMNIILSAVSGHTSQYYSLSVINDPFPQKTGSSSGEGETCGLICIIFALLLSFAFGFISATTVSFPMRERRNGMKHLQLMTGVHPAAYWAADYICDLTSMLIMTAIIVIIFAFDPSQTFSNLEVLFTLMLFTALYFAWSGLAFSYFMSTFIPFKFKGFNFLLVFHVFAGMFPFMLLELAFGKSESAVVVFLRIIMLLIPGFAITCAIHDWFEAISRLSVCYGLLPDVRKMCDIHGSVHNSHTLHPGHFASENDLHSYIMKNDFKFGRCCERVCKQTKECFKEPSVLDIEIESLKHPQLISDIIALILSGLIYWLFLIIAEKRIFARIAQHVVFKFLEAKEKKRTPLHSPKDLKHEGLMVKSIINEETFPGDVAMVVENLTKSFTSSMVINNFNLEVKKGECIGILGAGGSGKTALMKMMSGADIPTKGMCYIGNSSLLKNRKAYLSSIGYCPQTNALFDNFTGIEMLQLMGKLRGIPSDILSSHVAKWLLVMGLSDAGKDRCKVYGPGMQRRLVCAMALIGNCPLIFLDEATSQVDPIARERFWAVMEHLKNSGHTILFTTFHTEECLNLATKLVIIAEGNVQCLGSPDDLKNRYARGFCITFRLRHDVLTPVDVVSATMGRVVEFKKAIEGTFIHCDVIDEQDNLLLYFLRDTNISWGDVFRRVADLSEQFSIIIETYDVNEAAIEDLFILLTNKYREMDNPRRTEPGNEFDISKEEAELKALEQAAQALHMRI